MIRLGAAIDIAACVSLWAEACAARDGQAIAGVADRARPKFERAEWWIVAEQRRAGVMGFVLATVPGSGLPTDPPDAAVVGLLAVAPSFQGAGLGGDLLAAVEAVLARRGHARAVLHVLADNCSAVRLYVSRGWQPLHDPFDHSLLQRRTQTYVLDLHS